MRMHTPHKPHMVSPVKVRTDRAGGYSNSTTLASPGVVCGPHQVVRGLSAGVTSTSKNTETNLLPSLPRKPLNLHTWRLSADSVELEGFQKRYQMGSLSFRRDSLRYSSTSISGRCSENGVNIRELIPTLPLSLT